MLFGSSKSDLLVPNNMNELQKDYAKWKELTTKDYMLYFIHMNFQKS